MSVILDRIFSLAMLEGAGKAEETPSQYSVKTNLTSRLDDHVRKDFGRRLPINLANSTYDIYSSGRFTTKYSVINGYF